jgi:hypothetical protein
VSIPPGTPESVSVEGSMTSVVSVPSMFSMISHSASVVSVPAHNAWIVVEQMALSMGVPALGQRLGWEKSEREERRKRTAATREEECWFPMAACSA